MNKLWERPITEVQKFEANEYVAACGESGVQYIFECNAEAGDLYYYDKRGFLWGPIYVHPNPTSVHIAESTEEFAKGFIDYNHNQKQDAGEKVIVWVEYGRWGYVDHHATSKLDMNTWETAKS